MVLKVGAPLIGQVYTHDSDPNGPYGNEGGGIGTAEGWSLPPTKSQQENDLWTRAVPRNVEEDNETTDNSSQHDDGFGSPTGVWEHSK